MSLETFANVRDGYHEFFEKRRKEVNWRPATEEEIKHLEENERRKKEIWDKAKREAKRKPYYGLAERKDGDQKMEGTKQEMNEVRPETAEAERGTETVEQETAEDMPQNTRGTDVTRKKPRWDKAQIIAFLRKEYEERGCFPSDEQLKGLRE